MVMFDMIWIFVFDLIDDEINNDVWYCLYLMIYDKWSKDKEI